MKMKFVVLLSLVALCVAAVPSMRNRPWRMGNVRPAGSSSGGHTQVPHPERPAPPGVDEHHTPSQDHVMMPTRSNRRPPRKGTEGLRPVLQHDAYLGGEEETGRHQLPPFPSVEESRGDQPALDQMPNFTMKEVVQQARQRRKQRQHRHQQREQLQQQKLDYQHDHPEHHEDDAIDDYNDDGRDHLENQDYSPHDYSNHGSDHARQYQPHTDTIGHELFMMRTPPKFLLCYEGFDNGTTVMQKSCFTVKTDLQCRPLSELNVAAPDDGAGHHTQSKKHYCMPKTCHSDGDCQTVPNPIGSCRSQHGMRGGTPGLARCKIGCSAILFLAACRVSIGADIILERPCQHEEICTGQFHETLELGSRLMLAQFCHRRDYKRGLSPTPRELFCPPGHRSHQPIPEQFYGEVAPGRPQILGRPTRSLHHGPPHIRQNHHSHQEDGGIPETALQQQPPIDYSPIPESVLPSGLIPHATPHQENRVQYSVPVEIPPGQHYGVPSPLQVHHQIPPPATLENHRQHAPGSHYVPRRRHGYAPPFYGP